MSKGCVLTPLASPCAMYVILTQQYWEAHAAVQLLPTSLQLHPGLGFSLSFIYILNLEIFFPEEITLTANLGREFPVVKILGRTHDLDLSSHAALLCHSFTICERGAEYLADTLGAVTNDCMQSTTGPMGTRLLMTAKHSSPTRNIRIAPVQEGETIFCMLVFLILFCYSANHFPYISFELKTYALFFFFLLVMFLFVTVQQVWFDQGLTVLHHKPNKTTKVVKGTGKIERSEENELV